MEGIQFSKYHGLGNDFLIFEARQGQLPQSLLDPDPSWVKKICNRQFGVGADGLILSLPAKTDGDVRMQIFNADGTEAEMCGNGIRCLARFLADSDGYISNQTWKVETKAGLICPSLDVDGQIRVDMGAPVLKPDQIPTTLDVGEAGLPNGEVKLSNIKLKIYAVGMGNPHVVVPVEDLTAIPIDVWGPALENDPVFPSRTNVHFLKVHNRQKLEIVIWERGSGPTLACGTGACATLVCASLLDLCDDLAQVKLPGGNLEISWSSQQGSVLMSGPAEAVFDGILTPSYMPDVLEYDQEKSKEIFQKDNPNENSLISALRIKEEMSVPKVDNDNRNALAIDAQSQISSQTDDERKTLKKVQKFLSGTSLDSLLQIATDSLEKRTKDRQDKNDTK